jgi:transcriptional regulator with XRE-family HTH domain
MTKSRQEWAQEFGVKLREVRLSLGLTITKMAARLGLDRTSYVRNEAGRTMPGLFTFIGVGRMFNISLDWLLLNRGGKAYEGDAPKRPIENVSLEIQEMVEEMNRTPSLRHELLAHYFKYKEAQKQTD